MTEPRLSEVFVVWFQNKENLHFSEYFDSTSGFSMESFKLKPIPFEWAAFRLVTL